MLPGNYLIFAYLLVLSFGISLILTALMRRLSYRLNVLDHPAGRKSHDAAMPLLGGAAVFLTFHLVIIVHLLFLAVARPFGPDWLDTHIFNLVGEDGGLKLSGMLLAGTMIFILGIIDDLHVLTPWMKLAGQIATALVLVLCGLRIQAFVFTDPVSSSLVTVFWMVLMMNSMNLLDNMDGLCGGVSIIAAATFFLCVQPYSIYVLIRILLVIFAGAMAGFLFFNLPPARIFMGDSGAMFSGYFLATIATLGTFHVEGAGSRISIVAPLMALSVPLFDTLSVMFIRWRNGDSIMLGDKRHFSHRLVEVGMRPPMAVYFIYMVAALVGLNGVLLPQLNLTGTVVILTQTLGIFLLIILLMNAGKQNGAR